MHRQIDLLRWRLGRQEYRCRQGRLFGRGCFVRSSRNLFVCVRGLLESIVPLPADEGVRLV